MRRALVAAAFLAALTGAPAPGGVPQVDAAGVAYKWDLAHEQPNVVVGKVTFFPHAASLRDTVMGQKTATDAVRAGVHEWEVGTTAIRFLEDASRPAAGRNGLDRVNYVGWVQSGMNRTELAVTTVTRDGGVITDMDVTLNDHDFAWDTFTPGQSGIADIEAIVTHEWGHALGADHVPLRTSTMYAVTQQGAISSRSIAPDDRALVGSMYPNAAFQSTTGAITGAVDLVGSTNDRAVHVVAVSVATGEPAASTLTRADGAYRIEGLPAGAYRLVAAPCLPLKGSMNAYWTSGSTRFLPSVLRASNANPAQILPLAVVAGQTVTAPAMTVADATAPFEADASTPIEIGDAVCARFETGGDEDWYTFAGVAGEKVAVNVLSWGLGASADPAMTIFDATGAPVLLQEDARTPFDFGSRIEGQDLDVRVPALTLPSSGVYRIRLTDQTSSSDGEGFYVLMLTATTDAPSAALTSVVATPSRLDADGVSKSTIVVRPRKETGDDVGPGATVTLTRGGLGAAVAVVDRGDGTYAATVTAPTVAGEDRFTVGVTTSDGAVTLPDAATIVYLGPADGAASTFTVVPRRVDILTAPGDGLELDAVVRLTPRDARGEALGPGRSVAFALTPSFSATLGAVVDFGDGVYGYDASGAVQPGAGQVSATVDGVALASTVRVAFGFALIDVLADVQTDAHAYATTPGIRPKAAKSFVKAETTAVSAAASLAAGGTNATARGLTAAQTVLGKFVSGRATAHVDLGAPAPERDLSRAVREAALTSINHAVFASNSERRRVDGALTDMGLGDGAFAKGQFQKAARLWRRAFDRVRPLQPH